MSARSRAFTTQTNLAVSYPDVASFRTNKALIFRPFCEEVKKDGMDVCFVLNGFAASYLEYKQLGKANLDQIMKMATQENLSNTVTASNNIPTTINLHVHNHYIVAKPRRTQKVNNCSTIPSESHILLKALELQARGQETFCFQDVPELTHDVFKKSMQKLKLKDYVEPVEERTCPRFYKVTEKYLALSTTRSANCERSGTTLGTTQNIIEGRRTSTFYDKLKKAWGAFHGREQ